MLPGLILDPAAPDVAPDVGRAVPLRPVAKDGLEALRAAAPAVTVAWLDAVGFTADPGSVALLPSPEGGLQEVWAGVPAVPDLWSLAAVADKLPAAAVYRLEGWAGAQDGAQATAAAIGWALAAYRFTRYKENRRAQPRLVLPAGADRAEVERTVAAVTLVRDLVNTPAEDLGPADLAQAARAVAAEFGADIAVTEGAALAEGYPMIHAVGKAAAKPPCLIDLSWGDAADPRVTLVGKGICFDSGGLDIKPSSGMLMMKKDMGGAAHALALARLVMAARLPVRLRVLIPAAENAVSGNAMRPMDVLRSRKGLSVEVTNTDAEGRLVLADALAEADAGQPALLIDFATLTGAARVALGADLPALFSNDDALAEAVLAAGTAVSDPLWRLPLWDGYRKQLDSKVADLQNAPSGGFAGAITAALFLERFVSARTPWVHVDLYAWNASSRPGRPEGGEAMTIRAMFEMLRRRFGAGAA